MKKIQWLKYLLYMVLIFGLLLVRTYVTNLVKVNYYRFQMSYFILFLNLIINVAFGSVLGLEQLIKEIRKVGKWKVNLPKLILLGLPSLYCSVGSFAFYSLNKFMLAFFTKPLLYLFFRDMDILLLLNIVFGYVVVTSFYKEKVDKLEEIKEI